MPIFEPNTGKYQGETHGKCSWKKFTPLNTRMRHWKVWLGRDGRAGGSRPVGERKIQRACEKRQKLDKVDRWIRRKQTHCIFCGGSFMQENLGDAVQDHFHITGKHRGPAHKSCNLKLRIRSKTDMAKCSSTARSHLIPISSSGRSWKSLARR